MAGLFERARRLTYWLAGTPDDSPPPVPIPPEITPLWDHVAFFLNLRGRLPPEMTREDIMDEVNKAVTDRQLQAHVMAYLRDYHGVVFDPKLNPKAPAPRYYSSADRRRRTSATVTTGAPDEGSPAGFPKPFFLEPLCVGVPVTGGVPAAAAPAWPVGGAAAAPAAEAVTEEAEKEAPAAPAAPGAGATEESAAKEGNAHRSA